MPVVKSEQIRFEHELFVKKIRFSSRSGLFAITLPKQLEKRMDIGEVTSETLVGVEKAFKEAIARYKAAQTTSRKVIVYKIEANAWVYRKPDGQPATEHDHDAEVVFQESGISFAEGCGLTIYADVMIENTLVTADGQKSKSYEDVEHSIPRSLGRDGGHRIADRWGTVDDAVVIDWTPEREAWFRHVGTQFEDLVMKVFTTLGDTKKALQLMDAGRMLMAPKDEPPATPKKKRRSRKR